MSAIKHKIALSIHAKAGSAFIKLIKRFKLVEVRLEAACDLTTANIARIFASHKNAIATCRLGRESDNLSCTTKLLTAVMNGAAYVDIEIGAKYINYPALEQAIHKHKTTLIASFHDFDKTPTDAGLQKLYARGKKLGQAASAKCLVKIACKINTVSDVARLLAFQKKHRNAVIIIGMGEKGQLIRILGPIIGAPFTFAALSENSTTAPGQLPYQAMCEIYRLLWRMGFSLSTSCRCKY